MNYYRATLYAAAIIISLALAPLFSCGTTVERTPGEGGTTATATNGAGGSGGYGGNSTGEGATLILEDASLGGLYDGPAYDGDQSCAPSTIPQVDSSCCDGMPCHGNCELHDGSWQCSCYGVEGGCAQYNLVCCYTKSGCTTEEACDTTAP